MPQPPPARRASLPMYNLPEMRAANAAFWAAVRAELERLGEASADLPETLDFERAPVPDRIEADVLFSQVCGYPLQTVFRGQATILAAPVYRVAHCDGPWHAGLFIVHRDSRFSRIEDLRGCRFVYNSRHSNSGMNLPRRALAAIADGRAVFADITETHSQPLNIERVAKGEADATAVDCVTYAFFCRHRPALGALTRVLAVTAPSPALPFVTSSATTPVVAERLRRALLQVGLSPQWAAVRDGLLLGGIVPIESSVYAIQMQYEREAEAQGYPHLK